MLGDPGVDTQASHAERISLPGPVLHSKGGSLDG
jgi:hypothetical protein